MDRHIIFCIYLHLEAPDPEVTGYALAYSHIKLPSPVTVAALTLRHAGNRHGFAFSSANLLTIWFASRVGRFFNTVVLELNFHQLSQLKKPRHYPTLIEEGLLLDGGCSS